MGQEALQALGAQRLPASLKDALSALESAVSFKAAASALLGPALVGAGLCVGVGVAVSSLLLGHALVGWPSSQTTGAWGWIALLGSDVVGLWQGSF